MTDTKAQPPPQPDLLLAGRYRVLRRLGQGGMACVYEALDEVTDKRVATKLLRPERVAASRTALRQFEAEFHTLTQLAHPRVVAVHSYHKLPDGALYTMESLEGGDLREGAPLPYKRACALLCDICSALSLLHSRRLVHRDITPSNIRCTSEGHAKLIDFGAMVPFGTHKHTVGTPPFCAPEAVTGQPLDGRADLFSLGATAYYALTGRLAFSARTFTALRNVWRTNPPVPSRIVPGIPPELDQLVMSLITLAPSHRPRSANDVMERLTAIAGIELSAELRTESAYLATPVLVGRDAAVQQVRRSMVRASRGRGTDILITGPPGVGRSRLADACALEGKLAGAIVLRADARDANSGAWGGVRSLLDQLTRELGDDADAIVGPHATVLAPIWPGAARWMDAPTEKPSEIGTKRAEIQNAMLELCSRVAQQFFLAVTADDLERVDEPSASLLALLTQRARQQRIAVVVTMEGGARQGQAGEALRAFEQSSIRLCLEPLSREETEALLTSIFGEVANVRLVADRMHAVAGGIPRALMNLAQHLLDRGLANYQHGEWVLPAKLRRQDLPSSPTAAMQLQLSKLSAAELRFAQAMAVSRKPGLDLEQCQLLAPELDATTLLDALNALVQAHVVAMEGPRYSLANPGWNTLLTEGLGERVASELHALVAMLFEQHPNAECQAAEHLLKSDQPERAIDTTLTLSKHLREISEERPASMPEQLQLLPDNWLEIWTAILSAAERAERPLREHLTLKRAYVALCALTVTPRPELITELAWHFYRDAGIERYHELAGKVPDADRLRVAIEQTQAHRESLPENERGLPVDEAIVALARVLVQAIAMMGGSQEPQFLDRLPSLEPLTKLSPILHLIHRNMRATRLLLAGRVLAARKENLEMLRRMDELNAEGVDAASYRYMRLAITFSTGIIEAICGFDTAIERVSAIEHDPLFSVGAWRLRKLQALRIGNAETADRCNLQIERLKIQNNPPQMFEGSEVWLNLRAWMEIGDVSRIREMMARIEPIVEKFPAWAASRHLARGRILQLRGDPAAAFTEFDMAYQQSAALESATALTALRGCAASLAQTGRTEEAREVLRTALSDPSLAQDTDMRTLYHTAGLVEMLDGRYAEARRYTDLALDDSHGWQQNGVLVGTLHELRAQIAMASGDQGALETALANCAAIFKESRNPLLIARYEGIVQEAQRRGMVPEGAQVATQGEEDPTQTTAGPLLGQAAHPDERAKRILRIVVSHGLGGTAFLYLLKDRKAVRIASCGKIAAPEQLDTLVRCVVDQELGLDDDGEFDAQDFVTSTVEMIEWTNPAGEQFIPALLGHSDADGFVISGVIVHQTQGTGQLPTDLLDQLSAALVEAGDVMPERAAS